MTLSCVVQVVYGGRHALIYFHMCSMFYMLSLMHRERDEPSLV